nr:hypothetical protein GCM10020092_015310 [Actinoplanes digitatis]
MQSNGISIPAGAVTDGTRSLSVQVGTPIQTVDEIKGLYLKGARGPVRLDAVATVTEQLAPATSYTRTDGVDSLGIAVTAAPDGNPVNISHEVRDQLADLESSSGATLTVITDQAPFVEKSIESLTTEGMLGLLMAVIVILVFLLSIRSTLVTIVSIPLSVLIALIALYLGDYSLNLLTLGALTIAVGRVVDDSIVVLENIKRHLEYGEEKVHAIMSGVKEVAGAVTASTLTTVAVFAPIALVGGFVGQLFAPFAITVTVALVASLFVSLTVVPVLAYWFLRPAAGGSESIEVRQAAEAKELRSPLQRGYLPIIRWVIRSKATRWSTVAIGIVVLIGTMGLASKLETNFLDQSGQDTIVVTQDLPVGTDLATTDAAARKVEAVIVANDDVEHYQVTVGNGEFNPFVGSGGASGASFNVALDDDADASKVSEELRKQFEGMTDIGEVTIGSESGTGFDGSALAVVVQAADQETLESATKQVQDAMARHEGRHRREQHARGERPPPGHQGRPGRRGGERSHRGRDRPHGRGGVPPGAGRGDQRRRRRPERRGRPRCAASWRRRAAQAAADHADRPGRPPGRGRRRQRGRGPGGGHPDRRQPQRDGQRHRDRLERGPDHQGPDRAARGTEPAVRHVEDRRGQPGPGGRVRGPRSRRARGDRDRLRHHGRDVPQPVAAAAAARLHPVRGDRCDRAAPRDRHPARRSGADRRADARRHRGHQRHRADGPDQPLPPCGTGCAGVGDRGWLGTGCARSS